MEIKGILFDKDGTLIDFYDTWTRTLYPVLDKILEQNRMSGVKGLREALLAMLGVDAQGNIDPEGPFAWMSYGEIAVRMLAVMQEFAPEPAAAMNGEMLKNQLVDTFYEEICGKDMEYKTFTDLWMLMQDLEERDIRVGLATTDEYRSTKSCMEKLGIDSFISFYGTAGRGLPTKPDGSLIAMAAGQWGIAPGEIAVVGDTPNDMRFAANGGAYAVAVLSGTGKNEVLEPLADVVISSVDELIRAVDRRQ